MLFMNRCFTSIQCSWCRFRSPAAFQVYIRLLEFLSYVLAISSQFLSQKSMSNWSPRFVLPSAFGPMMFRYDLSLNNLFQSAIMMVFVASFQEFLWLHHTVTHVIIFTLRCSNVHLHYQNTYRFCLFKGSDSVAVHHFYEALRVHSRKAS